MSNMVARGAAVDSVEALPERQVRPSYGRRTSERVVQCDVRLSMSYCRTCGVSYGRRS